MVTVILKDETGAFIRSDPTNPGYRYIVVKAIW